MTAESFDIPDADYIEILEEMIRCGRFTITLEANKAWRIEREKELQNNE